MPGRTPVMILLAVLVAVTVACSADAGSGGGTTTTAAAAGTVPGTAPGGAVPIVDPASVEAFCALDAQLDQLAAEQIDAGVDAPEAFRQDLATFVTDNDAVIDQYVAAAPPEIRADVNATMDQTRAAVGDAALFDQYLAGTGDTAAANRVSAFIDANCTA